MFRRVIAYSAMWRTVFFATMLLGAAWQGKGEERRRVVLQGQFERPGAAQTIRQMKQDLAALLEHDGIVAIWTDGEHGTDVVSIRFTGSCEVPAERGLRPYEPRRTTVRLAGTRVRRGVVLPLTEVDCDMVRMGLESGSPRRQQALGSALARVLAHELFHYLGQTTGHSEEGIAKAVVQWSELYGGSGFDEYAHEALRHHQRK